MDKSTQWLIDELAKTKTENAELKEELETLKERIANAILDPVTHDAEGNHLTFGQIKDRQIKRIADLIFPPKIKPMMGLFQDTERDLSELKIGFHS